MFLLPLSFPLTFIVFFGEEYGWRYFLQTAFQERLGKRKGIIFLGIIWGICICH
ncbi:CPBP family intramembrane metalloprotease [Clostridium botulinum]|nr:CPBP family intramembrane metalloprotease [Clostridium botulinum]